MKIRPKFVLVIMAILLLGASLMMGWIYYSSFQNVSHQAIEGNITFSQSIVEAVKTLMDTGLQENLEDYFARTRTFDSVNEIRVVRSPMLEKELGLKEGSRVQDDLDRRVVESGQEIIRKITINHARAIRIIFPIRAEQSCLACHADFKKGDVMSALSVTLLYQKSLDELMGNIAKNGVIQLLIISFVLLAIFIFFDNVILGPIVRIGNAVRKFGKGGWTAADDLFGKNSKKITGGNASKDPLDEISELAASFRDMAHDLKLITVSRNVLEYENEARKRTEEALIESKKRFDRLSEESSTINWEIDAEGLYTYIGHVSETVLGYRPEELVGRMHFYDLHPEEGRMAFKQAAFESFGRRQNFLGLVNPVQAKDGHVVFVSTNGIPILNPDGTLRGYSGSDTDITGRKKAEELDRARTKELEVFYKSSVGREERIIELKKEVERLKKELGK